MKRSPSVGVLVFVLLLALAGGGHALAASGRSSVALAPSRTATPIEHVIVLMQEGHSFDNYFGTYPGADGIPKSTCLPRAASSPTGDCVRPFHIGNRGARDLPHGSDAFFGQYDSGRMDGFVRALGGDATPMGYYDGRDVPFYWNVARTYVLFDRFFSSAHAGSLWNHLYWVTATPGNARSESIPRGGFRNLPTIFDRLTERGISWKFYVERYSPNTTFRNMRRSERASQVRWAPLLAFPRYIDSPRLFRHIVGLDELYADLFNDTLPAVSYIAPSSASEHPPGSIQAGQRLVQTLLNGLMRSRAWNRTAFILTYDSWGGWYDHVAPPQVDAHGYGFRVPALLVSAYARRGHVVHATLDFTSILRFIEDNWKLRALASRDARASSIASAFDFSRPPRPASFIPWAQSAATVSKPQPAIIYVSYGTALLVGLLAVAGLALIPRRAQRGQEQS